MSVGVFASGIGNVLWGGSLVVGCLCWFSGTDFSPGV